MPDVDQATKPSCPQIRPFEFVTLHYYLNSDIAVSLDTGAAVKALCGLRGPVGAGGRGAPEGTRTVVCPLCATVHAAKFGGAK